MVRPIEILNPDHAEQVATGVCTTCRGDATQFNDELSQKEHGISGMCQSCQDEVFNGTNN
jgi:hypothetical protein